MLIRQTLIVLLTGAATALAESPGSNQVNVVVNLVDGSRVVGRIAAGNAVLSLTSEAVGKLNVPLGRIRQLDCAGGTSNVTAVLHNGDKLHGALRVDVLGLKTSFGPVTIPMSAVRTCEFSTGDDRPIVAVKWDRLPFPTDSDWPGSKGEPAQLDGEEVILRGQPVRNAGEFVNPFVIECELKIEQQTDDRCAGFVLFLCQPGEPRNLHPVKAIRLGINSCQDPGGNRPSELSFHRCAPTGRGQELLWRSDIPTLPVGEPIALRVELGRDGIVVVLNGRRYEAADVAILHERLQFELWNWLPDCRWRVRGFQAR